VHYRRPDILRWFRRIAGALDRAMNLETAGGNTGRFHVRTSRTCRAGRVSRDGSPQRFVGSENRERHHEAAVRRRVRPRARCPRLVSAAAALPTVLAVARKSAVSRARATVTDEAARPACFHQGALAHRFRLAVAQKLRQRRPQEVPVRQPGLVLNSIHRHDGGLGRNVRPRVASPRLTRCGLALT